MPSSVLATVRGVELIHAGTWNISTGVWDVNASDLAEAVAALDCPAVRRPVLKLGHVDPRFDGEPAIGFVANMATASDGQALVGDWVGIPSWLTETDDEGRSVLGSAYPDRSVEGSYDWQCQLGHVHPFVLTGVALLGVTHPGVGTLASLSDVAALYGIDTTVAAANGPTSTGVDVTARLTSSKGVLMPAPAQQRQVAAAVNVQDVRRAFYDGPAEHEWSWWITDVFLDPNYLLVMDDSTDVVYQVPFTITGDDVTFDDPKTGQMVWQPVADVAAATTTGRPAASESFTTREQSRPAAAADAPAPQTPPAEPVVSNIPNPTQEVTVPSTNTLSEGLRQRLGGSIPADADEQTLLTALDEALAERAEPVTTTQLPSGTVAIDSGTLEQLQVAAQAGREAREEQLTVRRQALVDAAIGDGRVAPARRDHWLASLAADPGAEQSLATLAKGLIPVEASGHAGASDLPQGDPAGGDDYWFGTTVPAAANTEG